MCCQRLRWSQSEEDEPRGTRYAKGQDNVDSIDQAAKTKLRGIRGISPMGSERIRSDHWICVLVGSGLRRYRQVTEVRHRLDPLLCGRRHSGFLALRRFGTQCAPCAMGPAIALARPVERQSDLSAGGRSEYSAGKVTPTFDCARHSRTARNAQRVRESNPPDAAEQPLD